MSQAIRPRSGLSLALAICTESAVNKGLGWLQCAGWDLCWGQRTRRGTNANANQWCCPCLPGSCIKVLLSLRCAAATAAARRVPDTFCSSILLAVIKQAKQKSSPAGLQATNLSLCHSRAKPQQRDERGKGGKVWQDVVSQRLQRKAGLTDLFILWRSPFGRPTFTATNSLTVHDQALALGIDTRHH